MKTIAPLAFIAAWLLACGSAQAQNPPATPAANSAWTSWIPVLNGYYDPALRTWAIAPTQTPHADDERHSFAPNGLALARQGKKYGYIDTRGKWKIKPQFDSATSFNAENLALTLKNKKYTYINPQGKNAFKTTFAQALEFTPGAKTTPAADQNNIWGFIDLHGKWQIKPQFTQARPFSAQQLAAARNTQGKWGYINTQGDWAIAAAFDQASDLAPQHHLAAARQGDKWGYLDTKGNWAIAPQFEQAHAFAANGLARARQNGKWGYINTFGRWVIPVRFDEAEDFDANGLAAVRQNGRSGYINERNEWVIAAQFAQAWNFNPQGWARVLQESSHLPAIINTRGEWILRQEIICKRTVIKDATDEIIWPAKFKEDCRQK